MIVVGNNGSSSDWSDNAETVFFCLHRTIRERVTFEPLSVIGVGGGAVTTRYSLCKFEALNLQHETALYVSYNGAAPSADEASRLSHLGDWPRRPRLVKAVSRGFSDTLDDEIFDEVVVGDPSATGAFISQQLGASIIALL